MKKSTIAFRTRSRYCSFSAACVLSEWSRFVARNFSRSAARHLGVDVVRIAPADLGLGGMHVDVDLRGVDCDKQERYRIARRIYEAAVRRLDRVRDELVAHVAAVDEHVLPFARPAAFLRRSDPALDDYAVALTPDRQQNLGELGPVEIGDALAAIVGGCQRMEHASLVLQRKRYAGCGPAPTERTVRLCGPSRSGSCAGICGGPGRCRTDRGPRSSCRAGPHKGSGRWFYRLPCESGGRRRFRAGVR